MPKKLELSGGSNGPFISLTPQHSWLSLGCQARECERNQLKTESPKAGA